MRAQATRDPQPPVVYEFGDFEFVAADRLLTRHGTRVSLSPKAIDTLAILINARGRLVTKDELLSLVWPDTFVEENSLTRNVSVLRKALGGDSADQEFIETVPKSGYRFSATVRERQIPSSRPGYKGSPRAAIHVVLLLALAGGVYWAWRVVSPSAEPASNPDAIRQIAVLPLNIIGPASGLEHLAVGIPDTIVTRLASVQTLRVRSTGLSAPSAGADPLHVGREMGVDHVLGGTLQAVGGIARINLQLLRISDSVVAWGEALELPVDQLLALQDHAVTDRVVEALHLRTTDAERERAFRRYTERPDAYALYLRGRSLLVNYTDATMTEAISRFEEALRLDPQYVLARAGLASLAFFSVRYAYESEAHEWAARAEQEARRALEQDPKLAEAHLALASAAGTIHRNFDWRTVLAEADTALAINPNLELAHTTRARALFHMGLFEAAEEATRRADAGAPSSVENARIRTLITLHRGRFKDALEQAEQLARRTDAPAIQSYIAMSAFYLGDPSRGRHILGSLKRGGRPDIRGLAFLAAIEAADNNDERATGIIRSIEAQSYMDHHVGTSLAGAQAQLGNFEEATRWLRWAANAGFPCHPWFDLDPLLQPLRNDPGYVAFIREVRVGFDDVQQQYGHPSDKRSVR